MLTAEMIQTLKRSNISKNGELTKQRVKELLDEATREQKSEIDALAGLNRVSVNRVYTTGSISAKIAVAVAMTLNIDPFYLTGEVSERGECREQGLLTFLKVKGYNDLSRKAARLLKKQSNAVPDKINAAEPVLPEQSDAEIIDGAEQYEPGYFNTTEDDAVQQLKTLFLHTKYSVKAKEALYEILRLLSYDRD